MPYPTDEEVEVKARELFEADSIPDRGWDAIAPESSVEVRSLRPLTNEEKEIYLARAREQLSKSGAT
jgi:hypothetical protein